MKISYIIPVYNGSASIIKCLDHIIDQRGNFQKEIIVVDDGSSDGTYNLVYNHCQNRLDVDKKLFFTY